MPRRRVVRAVCEWAGGSAARPGGTRGGRIRVAGALGGAVSARDRRVYAGRFHVGRSAAGERSNQREQRNVRLRALRFEVGLVEGRPRGRLGDPVPRQELDADCRVEGRDDDLGGSGEQSREQPADAADVRQREDERADPVLRSPAWSTKCSSREVQTRYCGQKRARLECRYYAQAMEKAQRSGRLVGV